MRSDKLLRRDRRPHNQDGRSLVPDHDQDQRTEDCPAVTFLQTSRDCEQPPHSRVEAVIGAPSSVSASHGQERARSISGLPETVRVGRSVASFQPHLVTALLYAEGEARVRRQSAGGVGLYWGPRSSSNVEAALRRGASNVRLFGSVAGDDADVLSDRDLLVDLEPDRSRVDLAQLVLDLEALLGGRGHIRTSVSLRDHLGEHALAEAISQGGPTLQSRSNPAIRAHQRQQVT